MEAPSLLPAHGIALDTPVVREAIMIRQAHFPIVQGLVHRPFRRKTRHGQVVTQGHVNRPRQLHASDLLLAGEPGCARTAFLSLRRREPADFSAVYVAQGQQAVGG